MIPTTPNTSNQDGSSRIDAFSASSQRWTLAMLVMIGALLLFFDAETTERQLSPANAMVTLKKGLEQSVTADFPADTRNTAERVQEQRSKFFDRLKTDYGEENFKNIFLDANEDGKTESVSRGRSIYTSEHGLSWTRLKQKFMIKILQAQIGREHQAEGKFHSRLVWATGGHSSSAGHGNFFDEAYTAVMERTMKPVFAALGVEFVARPYSMGGTSSGEEVALCVDQIFGEDIDVLSWDYGMLEPRKAEWKQLLYTYHAALAKNRPAAIGIEMGKSKRRLDIYSELEQLGMTMLYENTTVRSQMRDAVPDTESLTDAEIELMPPYVKRLKCGSGLEVGEPGCRTEKFNMTICPHRFGMAKWHPGWKMHALTGNTLSLFLIEVLLDAAQDLDAAADGKNLQALLDKFTVEEEEAYSRVLSSPIPDKLIPLTKQTTGSEDEPTLGNVSLLELYKRRPYCHTAILPAQIRFKGLLTENDNTTDPTSYDVGIPQPRKGDPVDKDGAVMRLAYDPNERHDCPGNIGIDYKDFFFLSSLEGSKRLLLPNDNAKEHYHVDTSKMLGMIVMCLTTCDWGKCKNGDLRDEFDKGPLKMLVNGKSVTEFTKIQSCWALKGQENEYQWQPNPNGQYEIEAKLDHTPFSFVRFSSFIIL